MVSDDKETSRCRIVRMNAKKLSEELHREGFLQTFVWQDAPGTLYPEHTHTQETAHIILSGEMTLTMNGRTMTYRAGGRCDVPAGTVRSAKMGPQGCRYLIGER